MRWFFLFLNRHNFQVFRHFWGRAFGGCTFANSAQMTWMMPRAPRFLLFFFGWECVCDALTTYYSWWLIFQKVTVVFQPSVGKVCFFEGKEAKDVDGSAKNPWNSEDLTLRRYSHSFKHQPVVFTNSPSRLFCLAKWLFTFQGQWRVKKNYAKMFKSLMSICAKGSINCYWIPVVGDDHKPNTRALYTHHQDSLLKVAWPISMNKKGQISRKKIQHIGSMRQFYI